MARFILLGAVSLKLFQEFLNFNAIIDCPQKLKRRLSL